MSWIIVRVHLFSNYNFYYIRCEVKISLSIYQIIIIIYAIIIGIWFIFSFIPKKINEVVKFPNHECQIQNIMKSGAKGTFHMCSFRWVVL